LLQKILKEKIHLSVECLFELLCFVELLDILEVFKVRKRQGEYPEVGLKKNLQKITLAFKGG
jgi:hypothetical protein